MPSKHEILKPYKKEFDFTYALGAFAAIEALEARPGSVRAVYLHSRMEDDSKLVGLCEEHSISVVREDRCLSRIVQKENIFAVAVVDKFAADLSADRSHIVLVNPSDTGNLGTILRTAAAFNMGVAVILPGADIWHPRTLRASQGAIFRVPFSLYESFEEYRGAFPGHRLYPFMLDAERVLDGSFKPGAGPSALIMGGEAAGLDESYSRVGTPLKIPQSRDVDSLNLAVAAGIAAWYFSVIQ
jgi:TrmH family RNA methyltransferase